MARKAVSLVVLGMSAVLLAAGVLHLRQAPRHGLAILAPAGVAAYLSFGNIMNRGWRPARLPRLTGMLIALVGIVVLLAAYVYLRRDVLPDVPREEAELRETLRANASVLPFIAAALGAAGLALAVLPAAGATSPSARGAGAPPHAGQSPPAGPSRDRE